MSDLTMKLERSFAAPVARVWQAWTDPAILPRWFGPEGFACITHEIDVRVGGQWRFDMKGMGMTFPNRHRWLELTPQQRIVFLMDGDTDAEAPHHVTVTMTPEGAGTRLVQTMVFPDAARMAGAIEMGAERLGYTTLAKLAALVETA